MIFFTFVLHRSLFGAMRRFLRQYEAEQKGKIP